MGLTVGVVAVQMQQRAVIGPEGKHSTTRDEELVQPGQPTTDGTRRVLSTVERRDHGRSADTEPGDEAANIHDCDVTERGCLEDTSDADDDGADKERSASAQFVRDVGGDEGADETAHLEGRNDVGGEVGLLDFVEAIETVALPLVGVNGGFWVEMVVRLT